MNILVENPTLVPVTSLKHYEGNARIGDVEMIKTSLTVNGQYRAIVVDIDTKEVLAGNHTLKAAKELGWEQIAVDLVRPRDRDHAKKINLVDNRSNDVAVYENEQLAELLVELEGDFEGTGFDQGSVDDLLASLEVGYGRKEKDKAPPLPYTADSQLGDLYELGPHRVICGDSRDPEVVRRLMAGELADMVWTDPPYGIDYEGKTAERLKIDGDQAFELADLLLGAFQTAKDCAIKESIPIYVAGPPGPMIGKFIAAWDLVGWNLRQLGVWVKDHFVMGHLDYHYRHELICIGYNEGPGHRGRGGFNWFGDNTQSSVFEIPKPPVSKDHPTMKPTELIEIHLENASEKNALIYEPFAGSGSTLVACEGLRRRCYAVELDPRYVDVVVKRWQKLTGREATLHRGQ